MNNINSKLVAKKLHGVITFFKERKKKQVICIYVFMWACVLTARLYSKIMMINTRVEITGMGEGYMYTGGWMVYHNFNFV